MKSRLKSSNSDRFRIAATSSIRIRQRKSNWVCFCRKNSVGRYKHLMRPRPFTMNNLISLCDKIKLKKKYWTSTIGNRFPPLTIPGYHTPTGSATPLNNIIPGQDRARCQTPPQCVFSFKLHLPGIWIVAMLSCQLMHSATFSTIFKMNIKYLNISAI